MSRDHLNQHEVRTYLNAFADGELDVERNLKVLEAMTLDPTHTRRVLHQQQLRRACAAAMDRPEHRCPDTLRAAVAALSNTSPATNPDPTGVDRAIIGRIRPWLPSAVAAMLIIGVLIAFMAPTGSHTTASATLISNRQMALFQQRHRTCAADPTQLKPGIPSPTEVAALPGVLNDYFGDRAGRIGHDLDLSLLGYDFQRVGVCSIPGQGAVHVVYRAADQAGHDRTISLWIRPDDRDLALTPDLLYTAESAGGQPVLLWKRDGRVHYLIGDRPDETHRAAEMLHGLTTAGR